MKVILTSYNEKLRNTLNGDSFRMANYKEHYQTDGSFIRYLELGHIPNVGEYLYFHGNYYEPIALVVTTVAYDRGGNCIIWCNSATLADIDPYLFTFDDNDKGYKISSKVTKDILTSYENLKEKGYLEKQYEKKCAEYGDTCNKLGVITHYLDDYLGLSSNTIIDYNNVWYLISEVLSTAYPNEYKWHRPNRWEFSEF